MLFIMRYRQWPVCYVASRQDLNHKPRWSTYAEQIILPATGRGNSFVFANGLFRGVSAAGARRYDSNRRL
jgi:hypothetical protein